MITLANLKNQTAQAVFDHVKAHLLTQGQRAMHEGSLICAYRSPQGLRCAAGCLIAPAEYHGPYFEGRRWDELVRKGLVPDAHSKLILALQVVHDRHLPANWALALAMVVRDFGLEMDKNS